jgi:hypothetical protein
VQSASGAICYSAEPVDGALGGIELIGHGEEAGEGADVACGDALAVGADDAADESGSAGASTSLLRARGRCAGRRLGALSAGRLGVKSLLTVCTLIGISVPSAAGEMAGRSLRASSGTSTGPYLRGWDQPGEEARPTTKATKMMQVAFPDSAKDDAFTRSDGRCECTRGSRPVIPASWRAPPGAGVNAATGTSARSGTWWDHLRKRASNGRIPRGADHGART